MSFMEFISELWYHHRGKLLGILIGLIFGCMVISFGFWSALFICLCIVVGFFIGKALDGGSSFKEIFDRLFSKKEQ